MGKAEAVIQTEIIKVMNANGFMAWRQYTGPILHGRGRKTPNPAAGQPDVMALKDGNLYCVEVKGPTTKVHKNQKEWLEKAEDHGALCFVITSADEFLTEIGLRSVDETPLEAFLNGVEEKEKDHMQP